MDKYIAVVEGDKDTWWIGEGFNRAEFLDIITAANKKTSVPSFYRVYRLGEQIAFGND